tara:strand:+ start:1577 stop:2362 length:786 start_codon:yes stop_codon:yes gene_type:complete
MKKNFISILVTNYNKSKFLKKSLSSINLQNYKNYEIIIFDDCSSDNSIEIINKFKNIKLIKNNKKRKNSPALNQINGLKKAYSKSKGDIICLMDGDDYFKKEKLNEINKYFEIYKEKKILYNLPIVAKKNNFNFSKIRFSKVWPTIFPTSCISIKSNYLKLFFQNVEANKYDYLEIDTRINIFFNFYLNDYNVLYKKLTNYNYDNLGITSNINKYSKRWWFRRSEAFDYLRFILNKKQKIFKINPDYFATKFICFVLRFFK